MLISFLHFHCYSTWDCISHILCQVHTNSIPSLICRGIYRCNTSLEQQRWSPIAHIMCYNTDLILSSWADVAHTKCVYPSQQRVKEWARSGKLTINIVLLFQKQYFLYNAIKNIWSTFYSIWLAFAFIGACAKPLFLLGLEVTTALIFGHRLGFLMKVI